MKGSKSRRKMIMRTSWRVRNRLDFAYVRVLDNPIGTLSVPKELPPTKANNHGQTARKWTSIFNRFSIPITCRPSPPMGMPPETVSLTPRLLDPAFSMYRPALPQPWPVVRSLTPVAKTPCPLRPSSGPNHRDAIISRP